jgi:hypothetical protein
MLMLAVQNTNRPQGVVAGVGRLASDEAAPCHREEGAGNLAVKSIFQRKRKFIFWVVQILDY